MARPNPITPDETVWTTESGTWHRKLGCFRSHYNDVSEVDETMRAHEAMADEDLSPCGMCTNQRVLDPLA